MSDNLNEVEQKKGTTERFMMLTDIYRTILMQLPDDVNDMQDERMSNQ